MVMGMGIGTSEDLRPSFRSLCRCSGDWTTKRMRLPLESKRLEGTALKRTALHRDFSFEFRTDLGKKQNSRREGGQRSRRQTQVLAVHVVRLKVFYPFQKGANSRDLFINVWGPPCSVGRWNWKFKHGDYASTRWNWIAVLPNSRSLNDWLFLSEMGSSPSFAVGVLTVPL